MDNITPYTEVAIYQQPLTAVNSAADAGTSFADLASSVQNTIDQDNLHLVNNAAQTGDDLIHNQGSRNGFSYTNGTLDIHA